MICKNCGTDNRDDISFCTSCGQELVPASPPDGSKTPKVRTFSPKKLLTLLSSAAVVLLVLILVVSLLFHNKAETAVEDLFRAAQDYDYRAFADMLPPAAVNSAKERLGLDSMELEVIDSKDLAPAFIADIDNAYQQAYGTEKGYIEDASIVYVELRRDGQSLTRDRISVYVIQVEGEWYVDALSTWGVFPFDEINSNP